jgi:hypothetical protein
MKAGDVAVPADMAADFRRRNIGRGGSVESFRFRDERIVIDDIDRFYGGELELLPGLRFRDAYPKACGHISVYLPGYSHDGEAAVVILDEGPSIHGMSWTILLKRSGGNWIVIFRDIKVLVKMRSLRRS